MIPLSAKLAFFSGFLVVLAGAYNFRRLNREMRILFSYFVISIVVSSVQYVFAISGKNNLWTMHIFTPVQLIFLITVFIAWQRNASIKRFMQGSVVLFLVVWLLSILLLEQIQQFNWFTRPLQSFILIVASGVTFFQVQREELPSILRDPRFWVSAATLLYFCGVIVLFALSNKLLAVSIDTLRLAWPVQAFVAIMTNILYGMGFMCLKPR